MLVLMVIVLSSTNKKKYLF